MNIIHHPIPIEKHQSNGRIERLHRALWQALRKYNIDNGEPKSHINEIMQEIIQQYNNTWHRAIRASPNELWASPGNETYKRINSHDRRYAKEYTNLHRDKFIKRDSVYIQASALDAQEKLNSRYKKKQKLLKF